MMEEREGQVVFPRNAPDFNITQAGSTCQEGGHCSLLRLGLSFRIGNTPSYLAQLSRYIELFVAVLSERQICKIFLGMQKIPQKYIFISIGSKE